MKCFREIYLLLNLFLSISACASNLDVAVQPPSFFKKEAVLTIQNKKVYPQIIKIDLYNNSDHAVVISSGLFTVPAESKITEDLLPINGKNFSDELFFHFETGIGDLTKQVDRSGYRTPFDANFETLICQYPHELIPAIDFCAPKGTKIFAAKDGIVILTVDKFGDGGNDPSFLKNQTRSR